MGNKRAIIMPAAILFGIFLPQAHFLSAIQPLCIGLMMILTFIEKIPSQEHGSTFRIEAHASLTSLALCTMLIVAYYAFHIPKELLLGGLIVCLAPPANAAPAMTKILGGNPVLALKILIAGHIIACITIPFIFGYFTGNSGQSVEMSRRIFNSIQPIISIPLAIAFGLRAFYPEVADKVAKFQKYTLYIWCFSVFIIISRASFDIRSMGPARLWNSGIFQKELVLSAVLCLLLFSLGWFFNRKRNPIEGSQSMGQKNTMLVIWIAQAYADSVAALCPVFYVIWQNLVLSWMSRGKKK